jgi:hypothetical protein
LIDYYHYLSNSNKYFISSGHRQTIFKWKREYDKISQQPENCENRNDPDLVQAFLKKWWVDTRRVTCFENIA